MRYNRDRRQIVKYECSLTWIIIARRNKRVNTFLGTKVKIFSDAGEGDKYMTNISKITQTPLTMYILSDNLYEDSGTLPTYQN